MPIYEYRCKKCNRTTEYMQRISDSPKRRCESCGGGLERLMSQTSFQLKGGGWYKDLYASQKPASSESSKSESGESKPGGAESSASGAEGGATGAASGAAPDGGGGTASDGASSSGDKKAAKPARTAKPAKKGSK